jgi:hypothetical protein
MLVCISMIPSTGAEVASNGNKSRCSTQELVDFIDRSLPNNRINAAEFESQFVKLKPVCAVNLSETEQIAKRSTFFESVSRGGRYGRWVIFVFRTRVNGQNFTAQFSVDADTGEVEYLSDGHHSL